MESLCYRCGSHVADQTPFCSSCGAPQIRVALPDVPGAELPEAPTPPPPPSVHTAPAPPILLRVERQTDRIHWKTFLRTALPLAAVVGFFAAANVFLAWLVVLPGSVMFAIHSYRRRQPGLLRPLEGAKLGACTGLVSFGFFAVLIAIRVATDPAEYRHVIAQVVQEALARNPSPDAQLAQSLFSGTSGVILLSAVGMAMILALLLVIGSVSGALAARFFREKAL